MDLGPDVDTWRGHTIDEHAWWNECAWFGFSIPERNVNGWFYFWHRPNMDLTAAGVALWDGTGSERHDCLFHHWFPFNPLPRDGEMFDFALTNGMSVELVEPLKEYRLKFDNPRCQLDLEWHGSFQPQTDYLQTGASADIGSFHYDQLGQVEGLIIVDGERLTVAGSHVRDRTWGVRSPFDPNLRGGLEMGWTSGREVGFVATGLTPEPPPADGKVTEPLAYGHFLKEGRVTLATGGTREILRGPTGEAERILVDLEDTEGRVLHAEGHPTNCLHYDDLWYVDWMLVKWDEIDGAGPGWGESQDMPSEQQRRNRRPSRLASYRNPAPTA